MTNLSTTYMNLKLKSPVVAASSPLTGQFETAEQLVAAGVGAIILPSMFEEQITIDRFGMTSWSKKQNTLLPGNLKHYPDMEKHNEGIANYLSQIFHYKQSFDVPIIASLNATTPGSWVEFASLMAGAGADAVELNIYDIPTRLHPAGAELITNYRRIVQLITERVDIPVAVKISPFFASIPNAAHQFCSAGAAGITLFNRFYQPDIDLETETLAPSLTLSTVEELRLRLRWAAILYGQVDGELAITGGVKSAEDVLKAILVGAKVVTVASAILESGPEIVTTFNKGISAWLEEKGYKNLNAILGKLSMLKSPTPESITRANYIRTLGSFSEESE